MSADAEILFKRDGPLGCVTLNRPQALNALTLSMIRKLDPQLAAWADDPDIRAVVIEGVGDRAFCAGGDIRALYDAGPSSTNPMFRAFFGEEYVLNRNIFRYPKPYIAILHGITMGGGCGLSMHGGVRVATENTIMAMPETGIGFFPDVGASHFLSRCANRIGHYLGLTGARIRAGDILHTGLATHYVRSTQIDDLITALAKALDRSDDPVEAVGAVLAALSVEPDAGFLPGIESKIAHCFAPGGVEDVIARLNACTEEWAAKATANLERMSPTSLKVTRRLLFQGAALDMEDCMRMELRVALRFMERPDFFEGVRAVLVDKDNAPNWRPATLIDVKDDEVAAFFAPLGDRELTFTDD